MCSCTLSPPSDLISGILSQTDARRRQPLGPRRRPSGALALTPSFSAALRTRCVSPVVQLAQTRDCQYVCVTGGRCETLCPCISMCIQVSPADMQMNRAMDGVKEFACQMGGRAIASIAAAAAEEEATLRTIASITSRCAGSEPCWWDLLGTVNGLEQASKEERTEDLLYLVNGITSHRAHASRRVANEELRRKRQAASAAKAAATERDATAAHEQASADSCQQIMLLSYGGHETFIFKGLHW